MYRVGQDQVYTVYIRYIWQGNHHTYGHIRCVYTVLASPRYIKQMVHSGLSWLSPLLSVSRVGQNHIYTPYWTVHVVIFLPEIPYVYMVLANSTCEQRVCAQLTL